MSVRVARWSALCFTSWLVACHLYLPSEELAAEGSFRQEESAGEKAVVRGELFC